MTISLRALLLGHHLHRSLPAKEKSNPMYYTIKVKSHAIGEIKDFASVEASVHQITNQPNLRRFVGPVPVEVDPQPTTIG